MHSVIIRVYRTGEAAMDDCWHGILNDDDLVSARLIDLVPMRAQIGRAPEHEMGSCFETVEDV